MRKLLCALVTLLMVFSCAAAVAASEEDIVAAMIEKTEDTIADMRGKASGWVKVMLDNLLIDRTEIKESSINLYVTVPDLSNALTSKVEPDDAADYLTRALADYVGHKNRVELKLNASFTEKNGKISLKWSGNSNPTKLSSSLKNMAGSAKKTYAWKNFTKALEDYLLPKTVVLPKQKPKEAPKIPNNGAYGKQVAEALGVTSKMAARRLPALMLLMDITKVDTTKPLEETKVTIKINDWTRMVTKLEKLAFEELEITVGASKMTREEMDAVLCARLNEALLSAAYNTKGRTTKTITVDVPKVVAEGVGSAKELMKIYKDYMKAMDDLLDKLMDKAATLSFYPELDLPRGGIMTGEGHEGGRNVIFTMGDDKENHSILAVKKDDKLLLTGFCAQLDRLMIQLEPGEYQVVFAKGPKWCGEEYLFGEEGQYGSFTLTVADKGQTRVELYAAEGGDAAVTDMPWDDVRAIFAPANKEE